MKLRVLAAIFTVFALVASIIPPQPAQADYAYLTLTGNPLAPPLRNGPAPYLVLQGMTGQSACSLTITTAGGNMVVEGLYRGTTVWTPPLLTVSPDGTATQTTESAVGSYVFNCATMVAVRVDGTLASGTPSVTLNTSGGLNRVIGSGVNGGRTTVQGSGPITVTNVGSTATVGLTTPLTIAQGGTNNTLLPLGCLQSDGTTVSSIGTLCAGASTPTSVIAGTGIAVATPSPGVFSVSNTGVLTSTGSGNILSSGGQNPNITISSTPSFTSLTASGLTAGNCVQAGTAGLLTTVGSPCGIVNSLTGTNGIAITGTASVPNVSFTTSPTFVNVTDSALIAGNCLQSGPAGLLTTTTTPCASGTGTVTAVTASGNMASSGGTTPNITITDNPNFLGLTQTQDLYVDPLSTTGSVNYGIRLGSGAGPAHQSIFLACPPGIGVECQVAGVYSNLFGAIAGGQAVSLFSLDQSGDLGIGGYLASATLTPGNCLQATTNGKIISTASACASGGVTSLTAGRNIVAPTSGATPTVAVVGVPTFDSVIINPTPNQIVLAGATTNTYIGHAEASSVRSVVGNLLFVNGGTLFTDAFDQTGDLGLSGYIDIGNYITALDVLDRNLTPGNCVQATTGGKLVSTTTPCGSGTGTVTAVTAVGNLSSTGGTTPQISESTNPTFTNITLPNTSSLKFTSSTSGCAIIGSNVLVSNPYPCTPFTTSPVVAPAVGATVNVAVINTLVTYTQGAPVTLTDGIGTTVSGYVSASVNNSTSFTFKAQYYLLGVPGNTIAAGNPVYSGALYGTKFLANINFGYVTGLVKTINDYPSQQVPGYTSGTILKLRASCKTADNGTTVFTFTDTTTAVTIGTIALTNGATTGSTTLVTPFILTPGDQLSASVTVAGTATGCGLTADAQASTF